MTHPDPKKPLTAKQEAFCLRYLEAGNASEAYRTAYNAEAMKSATVHRKAKVLLDNGKIRARLEELRTPVVVRARLTLEEHLAELDGLKREAREQGNITAAIRAEELRGKAAGLYAAKVDLSNADGSLRPVVAPPSPLAVMEELMRRCDEEEGDTK